MSRPISSDRYADTSDSSRSTIPRFPTLLSQARVVASTSTLTDKAITDIVNFDRVKVPQRQDFVSSGPYTNYRTPQTNTRYATLRPPHPLESRTKAFTARLPSLPQMPHIGFSDASEDITPLNFRLKPRTPRQQSEAPPVPQNVLEDLDEPQVNTMQPRETLTALSGDVPPLLNSNTPSRAGDEPAPAAGSIDPPENDGFVDNFGGIDDYDDNQYEEVQDEPQTFTAPAHEAHHQPITVRTPPQLGNSYIDNSGPLGPGYEGESPDALHKQRTPHTQAIVSHRQPAYLPKHKNKDDETLSPIIYAVDPGALPIPNYHEIEVLDGEIPDSEDEELRYDFENIRDMVADPKNFGKPSEGDGNFGLIDAEASSDTSDESEDEEYRPAEVGADETDLLVPDISVDDISGAGPGGSTQDRFGRRISRRTRVPPVAWWRGESVEYQMDELMLRSVKYIVAVALPQRMRRPNGAPLVDHRRQSSGNPTRQKGIGLGIDPGFGNNLGKGLGIESGPDIDKEGSEHLLAPGRVEANIFCVKTKEFAPLTIAQAFQDIQLQPHRKHPKIRTAPLLELATESSLQYLIMEIERGGLFPLHNSRNRLYVFFTLTGYLSVTVNDQTFDVRRGTGIQIPGGNDFSLENVGTSSARLLVFQNSDVNYSGAAVQQNDSIFHEPNGMSPERADTSPVGLHTAEGGPPMNEDMGHREDSPNLDYPQGDSAPLQDNICSDPVSPPEVHNPRKSFLEQNNKNEGSPIQHVDATSVNDNIEELQSVAASSNQVQSLVKTNSVDSNFEPSQEQFSAIPSLSEGQRLPPLHTGPEESILQLVGQGAPRQAASTLPYSTTTQRHALGSGFVRNPGLAFAARENQNKQLQVQGSVANHSSESSTKEIFEPIPSQSIYTTNMNVTKDPRMISDGSRSREHPFPSAPTIGASRPSFLSVPVSFQQQSTFASPREGPAQPSQDDDHPHGADFTVSSSKSSEKSSQTPSRSSVAVALAQVSSHREIFLSSVHSQGNVERQERALDHSKDMNSPLGGPIQDFKRARRGL